MTEIADIQTAHPMRMLSLESNFTVGERGVKRITRNGDTVTIVRRATSGGDDVEVMIPWGEVVAAKTNRSAAGRDRAAEMIRQEEMRKEKDKGAAAKAVDTEVKGAIEAVSAAISKDWAEAEKRPAPKRKRGRPRKKA